MYCPKCNTDVGNSEFCENCGSSTVQGKNNEGGDVKAKQVIKAERKEEKKANLSPKKILSFIGLAVVIIAFFVVFSNIKESSSPEATAEKYVNYLVAGQYDEAFKMLDIQKDSKFLKEKYYKNFVESMNLKGKTVNSVKASRRNDFVSLFQNQGEQSINLNDDIIFFETSIGSNNYMFTLIQKGKKFGLVNAWKIKPVDMAKTWEISAPKGTEIFIDGIKVEKFEDISGYGGFNIDSNNPYSPSQYKYTIDSIFPGEYKVTASLEYAKDIEMMLNPKENTNLTFQANKELTKVLEDLTHKFLDKYYAGSDKTEYENIVSSDSKLISNLNNGSSPFNSYISRELKNIEVLESTIDDVEHAKLKIDVNYNYEQEDPLSALFGEKKIDKGEKQEKLLFTFKKVGDNWLIVDMQVSMF